MRAATGRVRVFSGADGSTPIAELDKLLQALAEGPDIAIGSRYPASSLGTRPQPRFQLVWIRLVNRVVQPLLLPGVVDPHCGFKAFTAAAAEQTFSACTVDGCRLTRKCWGPQQMIHCQIIACSLGKRRTQQIPDTATAPKISARLPY